ncbi:PRC-barrel domain containing protein [Streptomyces sp. H27-C3]|uniref:PRC-barrel domain containing protein n=1 Tax=Streptomyces sp. H27-C3 TaxID=3046305 RepID=UPI0024B8D89D|nr:PRC-barrel domain containing protein [Streptomyces sp. H27-C3]MDJ0460126.1 PRC-barrel domain containing protein [Streptomyces sp. H27-C3]
MKELFVSDIWGYQPTTKHTPGTDLTGFKVEATDGSIGKVDKHSEDVGSSYIVVDTGVWIFGKHVLLPAGTVSSIDTAEKTIHVSRTKAEIKDSPEFDKDKHIGDPGYHQQVGGYYGSPRL